MRSQTRNSSSTCEVFFRRETFGRHCNKLPRATKYLGQGHVDEKIELDGAFDPSAAITSFATVYLGYGRGRAAIADRAAVAGRVIIIADVQCFQFYNVGVRLSIIKVLLPAQRWPHFICNRSTGTPVPTVLAESACRLFDTVVVGNTTAGVFC